MAAPEYFPDNAQTTLTDNPLAISSTAFNVAALPASVIPGAAKQFRVMIYEEDTPGVAVAGTVEILTVTSVGGTGNLVWQCSTTTIAHVLGSIVVAVVTNAGLLAIRHPAGFLKRTAGDLTYPTGGFAQFSTPLQITLPCETGDLLEFGINAYAAPGATTVGALDVATIVSAAIVNRFANTTDGVMGWYRSTATGEHSIGGSVFYVAQAGDISGGNVVLSLIGNRVSGSNAITLLANTTDCFFAHAVNHRH